MGLLDCRRSAVCSVGAKTDSGKALQMTVAWIQLPHMKKLQVNKVNLKLNELRVQW